MAENPTKSDGLMGEIFEIMVILMRVRGGKHRNNSLLGIEDADLVDLAIW